MPEDSATGGTPRVEGAKEPKDKNVTCEFCECVLFSSGEVKTLSKKAKGYRTADEEIERLKEQLQTAKEQLTEAEAKLRERNPTPAADPTPTPAAESKKKGLYI
jgi:hypothetical protein